MTTSKRPRRFLTSSRAQLAHIPGDDGLPVFGTTFRYLRDPFGYATRMHARFGPVFRDYGFFSASVTVRGAAFAERFFLDKEALFSSKGGWWPLLGPFFPGGLMLRDFEEHRLHRSVMQVAFRSEALEGYAVLLDEIVSRAVAGLPLGQAVPLYPRAKRLLLDTASIVFAGVDPDQAPRDAERLHDAFIAIMRAAAAALRLDLPFTTYGRGLSARAALRRYFGALARARQEAPDDARRDVLSVLCRAHNEDGERFALDDIIEHMMFLLMAAHDTTTSALTTLMMALALHPRWQEQARAESLALGHDQLTFRELGALRTLDLCMREALRLYPPVRTIPRRTTRACWIEGYQIPAGTQVWFLIEDHHRDPNIWSEPDRFDPERFAEGRAEHKRHRLAWIPFGAGAHTCLGLQFAELEIKAFLHRVLRRLRFALPAGYTPRIAYVPFIKPKDDLPLTFTALDRG